MHRVLALSKTPTKLFLLIKVACPGLPGITLTHNGRRVLLRLFKFLRLQMRFILSGIDKISALVVFFITVTLLRATPVFSEVVNAGVISFPPYYIVEKGEVKGGVYTDILERMMERAGLKYSIQAYQVGELFSGIENGDIHIWMGTPVNGAISSPRKIAEVNILVYTPSSISPPSSIDGLAGKRVLVIDGYNYGGLLKKLSEPSRGIVVDRVRSHETAFKRLSSGLERFVVDYQTPAEKTISDLKVKNLKSHILSTVDVKIYVSKKAPDPEKLMEQLMKAHEALKVEGHF